MKTAIVLMLTLVGAPALAGDYATCLLDSMPGSSNAATTAAIFRRCLGQYPNGFLGIERGSGRGWLSYSDQDECILKKAKNTTDQRAASVISAACYCLYKAPTFKGEECAYRQAPRQPGPWVPFKPD